MAQVSSTNHPVLHWVDNFARHYAANAMHINKDLYLKLLWTAHGVKLLGPSVDIQWKRNDVADVVPAMPLLEDLLHKDQQIHIVATLRQVSHLLFDDSLTVQRDVLRVPLKLREVKEDIKESKHLQASFDGLKMFFPVDIYQENIASLEGLVSCLRRVQLLDGFGLDEHERHGLYSFLHADVAIY